MDNKVLFVDNDKEIEVEIPKVNEPCPRCNCKECWKLLDYDWDGDRKFFRFQCFNTVIEDKAEYVCAENFTIYST